MKRRRAVKGLRPVSTALPKVTDKLLQQRGFWQSDVILHWAAIVGDGLADHCSPDRLIWPKRSAKGAILQVIVASGFAPEVQHSEPVIIERVNTYFGYRAITGLRLIQGVIQSPPTQKAPPERRLTDSEQADLDRLLGGIEDPELAAVLRRLGRRLIAAEPAAAN